MPLSPSSPAEHDKLKHALERLSPNQQNYLENVHREWHSDPPSDEWNLSDDGNSPGPSPPPPSQETLSNDMTASKLIEGYTAVNVSDHEERTDHYDLVSGVSKPTQSIILAEGLESSDATNETIGNTIKLENFQSEQLDHSCSDNELKAFIGRRMTNIKRLVSLIQQTLPTHE